MRVSKATLDKAMDKAEDTLIRRGILARDGSGDPDVTKLMMLYGKLIEDIVEVEL